MAGIEPETIPSVFASTYGDLPINHYMCSTLASTPLLVSPTRFHNSVHNAVSGYWTIGTGSMRASTALAAGANTFASGLLEAVVQALANDTPVLLVAYDVGATGPMLEVAPSTGAFGAAVVVAPPQAGGQRAAFARLTIAIRSGEQRHVLPPPRWRETLPAGAIDQAVPFLASLADPDRGSVSLAVGRHSVLDVGFTQT
jgi:hypothetical protein